MSSGKCIIARKCTYVIKDYLRMSKFPWSQLEKRNKDVTDMILRHATQRLVLHKIRQRSLPKKNKLVETHTSRQHIMLPLHADCPPPRADCPPPRADCPPPRADCPPPAQDDDGAPTIPPPAQDDDGAPTIPPPAQDDDGTSTESPPLFIILH